MSPHTDLSGFTRWVGGNDPGSDRELEVKARPRRNSEEATKKARMTMRGARIVAREYVRQSDQPPAEDCTVLFDADRQ